MCAGSGSEGSSLMTLREMAVDYRREADRFRLRVRELRRQRRTANDNERFYLDRRISEMTAIQRELREISNLLEHYYERGYKRNGKYTL